MAPARKTTARAGARVSETRRTSPASRAAAPSRRATATAAGTTAVQRGRRAADAAVSTKELIVRAAAEAFASRGYCGVNLTDVVEGLGYTKGALYFYFPTKEAVAVEIVTRHFATWEQMMAPAVTANGNSLEVLVSVTRQIAELYRTDPITRAGSRLSTERNIIDAELPEPFVGWIEKIAALLRSAKRAKEVRADIEPRALAQTIVSFFYGAQQVSEQLTGRQDLRRQLDQFWAVLLPAIKA